MFILSIKCVNEEKTFTSSNIFDINIKQKFWVWLVALNGFQRKGGEALSANKSLYILEEVLDCKGFFNVFVKELKNTVALWLDSLLKKKAETI